MFLAKSRRHCFFFKVVSAERCFLLPCGVVTEANAAMLSEPWPCGWPSRLDRVQDKDSLYFLCVFLYFYSLHLQWLSTLLWVICEWDLSVTLKMGLFRHELLFPSLGIDADHQPTFLVLPLRRSPSLFLLRHMKIYSFVWNKDSSVWIEPPL